MPDQDVYTSHSMARAVPSGAKGVGSQLVAYNYV
jgi:hypothetical protein